MAAFFNRWRLEVNLTKTKVMAFGVRGNGSVQVRWGGVLVEEVDEYKYLGLLLERTGKWKKEKEKMLRREGADGGGHGVGDGDAGRQYDR